MTPQFTLALSFDGIRLLTRADGGWDLVGEVAVDTPDLAGALSDLRARSGEKGDLQVKLLIPDDQIKYTQIDTAQTTLDDVHAALDGLTPYAIDELVIDSERSGGRTQIAAVAKETLNEAEGFAREHGFEPVAFVAAAAPYTFQAEVFFGPATGVAPDDVTRDPVPVRQTGRIKATDADAERTVGAPPAFMTPPDAPEESAPAPEAAAEPEPEPEVVFASRARAGQPKPVEPPTDAKDTTTDAPATEEEPPLEPVIEPLFTRRKQEPTPALADAPAAPLVAPVSLPADIPAPVAPRITPVLDAEIDIVDPSPATAPVEPAPVVAPKADPKPTETQQDMAVFGTRAARGKPRFLALKLTAGLIVVLFLIALWASTWSEDGIAGWFSGDDATPALADANVPTEAPTPLPADVPPVALLPEPEETLAPSALQDTPATDTAATVTTAPPLPVVRAPTNRILSPSEADRIYAATGVYQRAPRMPLEPRAETLADFRESAVVVASPRPEQLELPATDAQFRDVPVAPPLNPPPPGTTYQRDLRGFILATPDGVVTPDGALVIAGAPELVPPLRPGTEIVEAPDPGTVVAANGEGLVLIAGPPPLQPPLRPDGLVPNEPETTDVLDEPAVETEVTPQVDPAAIADALTESQEPPTEPVTPTEEEGLIVLTGAPPVSPPLRPATLAPDEASAPVETDPATAEETAAIVLVAGPPPARPPLRPATLQIPLTAQADPELAGFRPTLRPAGLAPAPEPEPEGPDLTSVIAAIADAAPPSAFVSVTPRAVASSRRPDTRPRNFDRVVAAAQTRIARAQAAAATPATAPTTQVSSQPARPTGAVPTTVARAATIDNAIPLRQVNLIGVYGRPGDRRALVRLSNGRFVKVEVGSSLDGGRVTAIGDNALNYVKRGRTLALSMPSG